MQLDFVGKPRGGYLSWRKHKENSFKVICYMTNWAQYRPNATKYTPSHIDPHLCTHLIYAFAAINVSNHEIKAFEWNDESKEDLVGKKKLVFFKFVKLLKEFLFQGRYEEFNLLKLKNPNLKTLLAVGGWNMGSKPFSDMSKNDTYRHTFIRSAVKLLRAYKFDGLGKF
jgi:chitinase